MNKHLVDLNPNFRNKVEAYLAWLKREKGIVMVPYMGRRDPQTQAKFWRQSRSGAQVRAVIADLKAKGAPFLASLFEKGPPASGAWNTNALPGQSWHQFDRALDCYWERNGKVEWSVSVDGANNGYKIFAKYASQFGLHSLASIGDWPHIQDTPSSGPHKSMSWPEIDKAMKAKFG